MTGPLPTSPLLSSLHRLGLTLAVAPEVGLFFLASTVSPSDSDPLDSAFRLVLPFFGAIAKTVQVSPLALSDWLLSEVPDAHTGARRPGARCAALLSQKQTRVANLELDDGR